MKTSACCKHKERRESVEDDHREHPPLTTGIVTNLLRFFTVWNKSHLVPNQNCVAILLNSIEYSNSWLLNELRNS